MRQINIYMHVYNMKSSIVERETGGGGGGTEREREREKKLFTINNCVKYTKESTE